LFPESEISSFAPGKAVDISLGYAQKNVKVFSGIITKHSIDIGLDYLSFSSRNLLVLEASDKAIKMTVGKKSELYEKKKDSEIMTTLLSSAGVTKKVAATTLKHDVIARHNCNDWEFLLNRAKANGMVVFNWIIIMSVNQMKTQVLAALSCYLLVSCASTIQQQSPEPLAKAAVAKPTKAKTPIRIEAGQAADIVNVKSLTVNVQVTMAYASTANFTGSVVPGYLTNSCYLQKDAAQALVTVAEQAERLGYKLQLLDCYRPQRASSYFMSWVDNSADQSTKSIYYPNLEKSLLKEGYIAAHSGHSRASTLDLTLLRKNSAGQWQQVDMGSAYDLFDPVSHLDSPVITTQQKANRLLLKDLMLQQGFSAYSMEWWHFTYEDEKYPNTYFDFEIR
jgi:D-alanyl-D-alanine dipeptidase